MPPGKPPGTRWSPGASRMDPNDEPSHVPGAEFTYLCQVYLIIHEIIRRNYGICEPSVTNRSDAEFARETLQRFLALGKELPLSLARGNKTSACGIMLQFVTENATSP